MSHYSTSWLHRITHAENKWILLIVTLWTGTIFSLMTADVWDESNAMLLFDSWRQEYSLLEALAHIWSSSVANLYRPFALSVAFLIDSAIPYERASWYFIRGFNAALLIAAFYLLLAIVRQQTKANSYRDIILALTYFGSGSVLIGAGWFANIFDVGALFFVLLGFWCLVNQHWKLAFLSLALSFFCKEIAILQFSLLLAFCWTKRIPLKKSALLVCALLSVFCLYLFLRHTYVPIGSAQDIHGFDIKQIPNTLFALFESLWWQHTRREPGFIGLLCSLLFFASITNWRVTLCALATVLPCLAIYLGMLPYEHDQAFTYLVFESRLYLMPVVLLLVMAGIWGRTWLYSAILVPIIWGNVMTYQDYQGFQTVYRDIYNMAQQQTEPLKVHYPTSPLSDPKRNLMIGDFSSTADYIIDTENAKLLPK